MYVLRLYQGWKYVKQIPYTKEELDEHLGNGHDYTSTKLVWVPEAKEVSEEMISSQPGVYNAAKD